MGTRPTSGLESEALWPLTADPGPWRVGVALHNRSRSDLSNVLAGLVVASTASRWRAWDRRSRAIAGQGPKRWRSGWLRVWRTTGSVLLLYRSRRMDCPR
jgi:hypothetical protein